MAVRGGAGREQCVVTTTLMVTARPCDFTEMLRKFRTTPKHTGPTITVFPRVFRTGVEIRYIRVW